MNRRAPRFVLALLVLGCAVSFAVRGNWPWARLSDVPMARAIVVTNPFRVVRDTLQRGEAVSTLLERQGIHGLNLAALARRLDLDPRRFRSGLIFSVRRDASTDEPTHVEVRASAEQRLRFIRTSAGDWSGEAIPIRWTLDTIRVSGEIESSLYEAVDREIAEATLDRGERLRMVYELAEVNEYTVDFSRDPQPGDQFAAVIERLVSEEGEVRFGRILASSMSIGGRDLAAFGFAGGTDRASYYDAKGAALKRAFLVTPVQFRHISSGFSRARRHPVLGSMRRHEGIDYAANTGTPVRAAGDGVVLRAGRAGGYGNLVEIRHRNGVTTRYGHLSRIATGLRAGMHVRQSQEVGKVGSTGLATGPHLHYEFRVDGVARDPRSIKGDGGAPLPRASMPEFERQRVVLAQLLDRSAPATASSFAD